MSRCLKSFLEHCGWEIKKSFFFSLSLCGELERVMFWKVAEAAPGAGCDGERKMARAGYQVLGMS